MRAVLTCLLTNRITKFEGGQENKENFEIENAVLALIYVRDRL